MPLRYKNRGRRVLVFLLIAIAIMVLIDRVYPQWFFGYTPPKEQNIESESTHGSLLDLAPPQATTTSKQTSPSSPQHNFQLSFRPHLQEEKYMHFEHWMKSRITLDKQKSPTVHDISRGGHENPSERVRKGSEDSTDKPEDLAKIRPAGAMSFRLPPPYLKYAAHIEPDPDKAKIVIIIDDLGQRRGLTQKFINLPGPLTLAFLPYAPDLQDFIDTARSVNHEAMLHMPMEPMSRDIDPGPDTLKVTMNKEMLYSTLTSNLNKATGYVGINNHMGSRLTQDDSAMKEIMRTLNERGLIFVDSRTIGRSVAFKHALSAGVPAQGRDIFLDHFPEEKEIKKAFVLLERKARRNGLAVAIGHPYPQTYKILKAWLNRLPDSEFQLVPVTSVLNLPEQKRREDFIPMPEDRPRLIPASAGGAAYTKSADPLPELQ